MRKVALLLAGLALTGCGMEQVDEGYRGIYTNWGKVVGDPLAPGLHFYNPFTSDIFEMDVREQKWEGQEACFTRDTQSVSVTFVATVFPKPEKIGELYSQFGREWATKIVDPAIKSSLKDVFGQYIADDIVSKREAARNAALKSLVEALDARGVVATRLDFVNLDFNDEYEKAVEAKVTAIQRAAEAKNRTVQVREEAEQKVMAAKADAEAMRIKSQALSQNKGLVEYEAIQKWDGKLPEIMFGSTTPIINLDKLRR